MKREDYTLRGWLMSLVVAVGVICLGLIPPFEVFGLRTERVDILSALRPAEVAIDDAIAEMEVIDSEVARANLDSMLLATPKPEPSKVEERDEELKWSVENGSKRGADGERGRKLHSSEIEITKSDIVAIEDFDTLPNGKFHNFIEKLALGEGVRIAVMGDSFVEGDIVTSDLRDILQRSYGGRGVGFVSCDIPFTTVRTTVKRDAKGWTSYSIMKHKSVPETLRDKFFASGYISEGGAGATVTWRTVDKFATLDSCTHADILLVARDSSIVELTIINEHDTLKREMNIAKSDRLRQIEIDMPMKSVKLKVVSGKILCYGASLEGNGGGVIVDNFSVRSNNGHAIYNMNKSICNDADNIFGYDLVVLQYGLNIMQPGQRHFTKYKEQLATMIDYAKAYFPNAAIMVLGVSDRWIKDEEQGTYVPIGSVDAMTEYQRAAAEECGVAFWNTSEAMAALGGMPAFVANGWAAGDYTHINFAGGKRIAQALANALHNEVYNLLYEQELSEESAKQMRVQREREIAERNTQILEQREAIINNIISIDTTSIEQPDAIAEDIQEGNGEGNEISEDVANIASEDISADTASEVVIETAENELAVENELAAENEVIVENEVAVENESHKNGDTLIDSDSIA